MDELNISEKDVNQKNSQEKLDQEARDQKNLENQMNNLELYDQTLQKKMKKQKREERNYVEARNIVKDDLSNITKEHKSSKTFNVLMKNLDQKQAQLDQKQGHLISNLLEKENCEIYEIIGEGGEGLVFSGKWENKDCAVKICGIDSEEHLADIRKEFDTIIQMENQLNTIRYYRYLEILEEQIAIIIMEKGQRTLKDEVIERIQQQNLFSELELLKIVLDLFDGLVELKNYSILHLDIKPANILINKDGNYIFTDFGISQMISTYNTYTEENKGFTEQYASPEQNQSKNNEEIISYQEEKDLNKDNINKVNHLSDVFSLGKVFLFLIEKNEKIKIKQNEQLNKFELFLRKFTQEYMILDDYHQRLNTNLLSIYFIANLLNQEIDISLTDYINKIKNSKLNINHFKPASDLQLLEAFKDNLQSVKIQFTQEIEDLENKGFLKYNCNMSHDMNITTKANNQQVLYPYKMNMIFYNNSYFFNQLTLLLTINANRMQLINIDKFKTFLEFCNNYHYQFENQNQSEEFYSIIEMLVDEYDINNYYIISDILLFQTIIGKTKLQVLFTQLVSKCNLSFESGAFFKKFVKIYLQNLSLIFSPQTCQVYLNKQSLLNQMKEYKSFVQGYLYYGLKEYENSLFFFVDALSIFEKLQSYEAEIATCQNCIGVIYTKFQNYDQALDMHQSSLAIRKSIYPENHVDIAISLNNVSYVLSQLGNHDLAFTLQKEAYKILNATIQSCTQISYTISNNFYEVMRNGEVKFTLSVYN